MRYWISLPAVFLLSATSALASPFSIDEAARCAAAHAFTVDAMEASSAVPKSVKRKMRDGLAMWEYELAASTPGATADVLQAAANKAVGLIRADMPNGDGPELAAARGDFLTSLSKECADKLVAAYGDKEHPVTPYLHTADMAVEVPSATAPVQEVAVESDEARGLR